MSRYDTKIKDGRYERLGELILSAKKVQDEILPLQAYLNTVEGQIKDIMKELNIDEYKDVSIVRETKTYVDLLEFSQHTNLLGYAVAEIDVKQTLSYMYEDQIDYKISQRTLEKVIEDTKIKEVAHEKLKYKNK